MRLLFVKAPVFFPVFEHAPAGAGSSRVKEPAEAASQITTGARTIDPEPTLAVHGQSRHARPPSIREDPAVTHQLQHAMDLGASRSIWLTGSVRNPGRARAARTSACPRESARRSLYSTSTLRSNGFQHGAFGHDSMRHIPPERDHQFSRQRHNADALAATARGFKPCPEPPGQGTGRLPPQPAPGELQRQPPAPRRDRLC